MVNIKENLKKYGMEPYTVAVIHGGPGASGEMAPVARELATQWGVLEPIQTAHSVEGQINELKNIVKNNGELPITLIGYSWGAWLSFLLSVNYPTIVKKLILVSSGPFEENLASNVHETRLNRLSEEERLEFRRKIDLLYNSNNKDKSTFEHLLTLLQKTDEFDPIERSFNSLNPVDFQIEIFQSVWKEAAELRRSGKLLKLIKNVKCSVIAIHGDYDPHPAEGIKIPFSTKLKNFKFILLTNCGHKPWNERFVKNKFYTILKQELNR
ncbi:MAG: alpha/beta hydrolase [Candidatus Hodarchaeales archaeon]